MRNTTTDRMPAPPVRDDDRPWPAGELGAIRRGPRSQCQQRAVRDVRGGAVPDLSWNIKGGSSAIEPLLADFWDNPNGFREQFKVDVNPTADNLYSYGSGDGARYQWLSRFAPLFHVMCTGVGMRILRAHWGRLGAAKLLLNEKWMSYCRRWKG